MGMNFETYNFRCENTCRIELNGAIIIVVKLVYLTGNSYKGNIELNLKDLGK